MKNLALALSLLILSALWLNPSFADRSDRRQHKQRARIKQGVQSGELTGREARRLRKQQKRFNKIERRAKKDGVVTKKEAQRLEKIQDRMSKKIRRQKHDHQKRMQKRRAAHQSATPNSIIIPQADTAPPEATASGL